MSLPIIIAGATAAYLLTRKKSFKSSSTELMPPVPPPPPPPTPISPDVNLYGITLDDFSLTLDDTGSFQTAPELVLDVHPGDIIRFDFDLRSDRSYSLATEAVEGSPIIQVEDEMMRPVFTYIPGRTPWGRYIADVSVHPGAGVVKLDFMMTDGAGATDRRHDPLLAFHTVLIRVS